MSDIKQAAKWMEQGKRVRRASFPSWVLGIIGETVYYLPNGSSEHRDTTVFGISDILAEDWEISE